MTPVTLTFNFESLASAHECIAAMARYLAANPLPTVIAHADRPDVGVSAGEKAAVLAPLPLPATTFNPFAPAEAAVAQVPPPPVAPSTAVAAAVPTAPVATPATSIAVPPAPVVPAPPIAPVAAVPVVPAAPSSPAGIEVDRDGFPWDARIHASGRAKVADGTWRQKRGLKDTPELKARVEAELRQAMGAPAAPVSAVVPTPPVAAPVAAPVVASPATTAPSAIPASAGVPTPPPVVPATETFATLMARVGPRLMAGQITEAQSLAVLAELGLRSYTQLIQRPDLVPAAAARYDALVAA